MLTANSPINRLLERRLRRTSSSAASIQLTRQGGVNITSYGELLLQVRRFAIGLSALGIERGQVVGIVGPGAPEATIAFLGCLLIGATVCDLGVGIDREEVGELVRRSQCCAMISGSRDLAEPMTLLVRQTCGERRLIGWGAASSVNGTLPFGQVCLKGAEILEREPQRASRLMTQPVASDDAVLLPNRRRRSDSIPAPDQLLLDKRERFGVRLTQENCISAAETFKKALRLTRDDRIMRLGEGLGLVELSLTVLSALLSGASIVYDSGELGRQQQSLLSSPTVLIADADELDALYRDLDRELLVGSAWRRRLSSWARRVGNEAARRRVSGFENGLLLTCSFKVADQLVLSEYRRLLGNELRRVIARNAMTRRQTRWFFEAIGISPLGFIGVPESAGVGLLEPFDDPRPGSYGKAMPGIGVRVDSEGQVSIRGRCVAENAVEREPQGWLRLGISAEIDDDGTVWPERTLGALDAPSLAVLPIAEHWDLGK